MFAVLSQRCPTTTFDLSFTVTRRFDHPMDGTELDFVTLLESLVANIAIDGAAGKCSSQCSGKGNILPEDGEFFVDPEEDSSPSGADLSYIKKYMRSSTTYEVSLGQKGQSKTRILEAWR